MVGEIYMTDLFKSQKIGFKQSSAFGDDLIAISSTEWHQWGKYNKLWGSFPTEKRELAALVTGAARTPQDIYFGKYQTAAGIHASAVNAIPLYYALGKVTNSGAGDPYTHVIEAQDVGTVLPNFVMRSEDFSSETGIYDSYLGNYIKNLMFQIDFRQRSNMASYGITTVGQQIAAPQFAGASSNLIVPGAHTVHYKHSSAMVFNWGGTFSSGVYSSGGTAMTDDVLDFSLTIDNDLIPDRPQSQSYPSNYVFGPQVMVATFDIIRNSANAKTIYTDFVTMQDNTTSKNLHFKIYQDATHYLQFDCSNFVLDSVVRNNTVNTTDLPTFRCSGMFETIKITALDPLAGATWYA